MQRRNQDAVEEAPSPFFNPGAPSRTRVQACDLNRAAGYVSAGMGERIIYEENIKFHMDDRFSSGKTSGEGTGHRCWSCRRYHPHLGGSHCVWRNRMSIPRAGPSKAGLFRRSRPHFPSAGASNLLLCLVPEFLSHLGVAESDRIEVGQRLCPVQAMKIEALLRADGAG
ncbi:hypothetical protein EKE94_01520 [Mesobaculum littorinae]|uniref:Uncharacterized protein n=1 Tax=Mesobaculum littorinae TaxID=2486419 RepID=A0A438AMV0_9RHOB|nr:hypothetical protein EKE94_01520 [Mesobaculum littorinae]